MDFGAEGLTDNPNFEYLHKKENTELRFLCEAFSLVDTINSTSMLLAFSNLVKTSKDGKIKWTDIPDLYPDDYSGQCNYFNMLERLYDSIDQVIRTGWVTPIRTKTLGALAMEIYDIKKVEAEKKLQTLKDNKKPTMTSVIGDTVLKPSQAWFDFALRLQKLYEFQLTHKNIHHDFQRSNYLPHPDSWKVYLGTFSLILAAFVFIIAS